MLISNGVINLSTIRPISSVNIQQYIQLALKHAEYSENEDGTWTVEIPILPGLVTSGDTREEAKEMAADAVRGWVELAKKFGDPIPEIEGRIDP